MRVIECNLCGELLQAGNEDDLVRVTAAHMQEAHAEAEVGEDQVREMVERDGYTATDS